MKITEKVVLFLTDGLLVLAGIFLAHLVRFEGAVPLKFVEGRTLQVLFLSILVPVSCFFFGLYRALLRYAGIDELVSLFYAVSSAFLLFSFPVFLTGGYFYPRSVTIVAWLFSFFLLGGVRLLLRLSSSRPLFGLLPSSKGSVPWKKVLVVGAGDAGETLVRELKRHPDLGCLPVGFVDEDPSRRKARIHGIPVLGSVKEIPSLIPDLQVEEIILSVNSPSLAREIVDLCRPLKVNLRTIPGVDELMGGRVRVAAVREIRIEDLLEREPVTIDLQAIESLFQGKSVLVTGAGGSIGSELSRQIAAFSPAVLLLLGRGENSIYEITLELAKAYQEKIVPCICDVRDAASMERILATRKPHIVFHAAAHKHVPLMEKNAAEAVSNNIFGTLTLARLCVRFGIEKFVFLSTDKSVNPTSIMGATKRVGEIILKTINGSSSTRFISVRFGNVLESRGSVVPTFRKQIALGGPVTVTHPQVTRYFMTIPEAVQLVLQAAAIGKGGEIFILDLGKPVKIHDLARNMIRLSGFEPEKDIPVTFVGLRPGEKLDESLIGKGEQAVPTSSPKILMLQESSRSPYDWAVLEEELQELKGAWERGEEEEIKRMLKKLVPEYGEEGRRDEQREVGPAPA